MNVFTEPDSPVGPCRFRLSRVKGWRKPEGGMSVAKPTKWGNPYWPSKFQREFALTLYRKHVTICSGFHKPDAPCIPTPGKPTLAEAAPVELAGKPLGCWCKPWEDCHADILLALADSS